MPLPCNEPLYPPGVIGVASSFLGRYREFDVDLSRVLAPPGSVVEWRMGVNIAHHFNNMIRTMLADPKLQWVWILGDDHVFRPNTLMNLLHHQVDMVTPLCLRRSVPYETVLHTNAEDGYKLVPLSSIADKTGLLDVTNYTMGNAGTLLSRKLCEAIAEPWYVNGMTHPEYGGSDLYFCEKVRTAGFKMYMDMETVIGHLTHAAVWPVRNGGGYVGELLAPGATAAKADENINWPKMFDDYRRNYDKLPFENHLKLYDVIAKFFPDQQQYAVDAVQNFLYQIEGEVNVLELGGWKGELATEIFNSIQGGRIGKWTNYELCATAVNAGLKHPKYKAVVLKQFFDGKVKGYNTLIMSHVLEHMKVEQFKKILSGLKNIKYIYIDAPIADKTEGVDWSGYLGSHVLEIGWDDVVALLKKKGFILMEDCGQIKSFRWDNA